MQIIRFNSKSSDNSSFAKLYVRITYIETVFPSITCDSIERSIVVVPTRSNGSNRMSCKVSSRELSKLLKL